MRQENVLTSEAIHVSGGWVNWRVECVTVTDDGSWGPFNETAGGSTSSKLMAKWKVRYWRRRLRQEALSRDKGEHR